MIFRKLKFKGVFVLSRPSVSLIFGVCLGIAISIILTPFIEERCIEDIANRRSMQNDISDSKKDLEVEAGSSLHYKYPLNKYVPENSFTNQSLKQSYNFQSYKKDHSVNYIHLKSIKANNRKRNLYSGKPSRPRYAFTELGIREKIFAAVISSPETISTKAVALNRTLSHYMTKVLFFVASSDTIVHPGMTILSFEVQQSQLPLWVIRYIRTRYSGSYDYYFFLSDSTYVRGHLLYDFVSHISVSDDVYLGNRYCSLDGGIILSQRLLSLSFDVVDNCIRSSQSGGNNENLSSATIDDSFSSCLKEATQMPCSPEHNDVVYFTFPTNGIDYDSGLAAWSSDPSFNESLTVYPITNVPMFYKLHRYFCQHEINATEREIRDIKDSIVRLSLYTPAGREGLTWPIGVPAALVVKTRFDVIEWEYFTMNYIYSDNVESIRKPLIGDEKVDIDEIIRISMDKININSIDKKSPRYTLHQLLNGYRRFVPHRGMEYILDLQVRENGKLDVIRETRLNVLRPLSSIEVLPMPFITENVQLNLLLPIMVTDIKWLDRFINSYKQVCLETGDDSVLTIVFLLDFDTRRALDRYDDLYTNALHSIKKIREQYPTRISWYFVNMTSNFISEVSLVDTLIVGYKGSPVISLLTVTTILSSEYLSRVKLNTISSWQIYFPIGFYGYKPQMVPNFNPHHSSIELKHDTGFFDINSYDHASFYASDYAHSRRRLKHGQATRYDLFQLFVEQDRYHIFRTIEPALKNHYRELHCPSDMPPAFRHRCEKRSHAGLATRSQLANLYFEQQHLDN